MCTVSMIMDHYAEKWQRYIPASGSASYVVPTGIIPVTIVPTQPIPLLPAITPEEIAEFRSLLDRAREYDRRHGEPDCELAEKKERLQRLASELGVSISFN